MRRAIPNQARLVAVILLGLALLAGRAIAIDLVPLPSQPAGIAWPTQVWPEASPGPEVDRGALNAAIDRAFAAIGRSGLPDTRALLVVHHGVIVAERYAPGFGPDKRFHSWSVAKSITQSLVGILVRQGKLDINAPADVSAWKAEGDPRRQLNLDHLLHFTSGLDNGDELKDPASSLVTRMLFGDRSSHMAEFAADVPLVHEPGTYWDYSTPTSMIVAAIVQNHVGGSRDAMLAFMQHELFEPLGMQRTVPEFDAGGTFMGGGFVYASARDYARFGLLYLRDGVWDGRRILPEGWVDYSRTPAQAANNGVYGANFWLNLTPREKQFKILPGGPESAFAASGNDGQLIVIVPTHDLLMVRLGELQSTTWNELNKNMAAIVSAFPALP